VKGSEAMTTIREHEIATNTGWATELGKGKVLRVTAMTGVALVCFNARDLTERFDQARSKVYNMRIWIGAGEQLFSKLNNPMMTMVADGFAPEGRHDLQYGMTSRQVLAVAAREGTPARWTHLKGRAVPDHGCNENLAAALAPWRIAAHDVPMPLNLFQHTEIDTATGEIRPLSLRPSRPVSVDLRAEMDLVVALSACLDLEASASGHPVRVAVLGGDTG
jgi:uncharacterized protein YcgI (DUF1989 family)